MRYTVKWVNAQGFKTKNGFKDWENVMLFLEDLHNQGYAFKLVCKKA